MKTEIRGKVFLKGGGDFRFIPGKEYSVDTDSFTEKTVHKFALGSGQFVFVQGDRIKCVYVMVPSLFARFIDL